MLFGARALQLGHVDMAIVGGASDCKGDSLVLFSHARALSSTGSRPFDAEADGIMCGEGYVALVMKTLDRALADGDRIRAVIRGLGVSSDGRGKSLWAPRKEGQIKAMERAYRGGLAMGDIEYLEAHATATKLGDATELNTLIELLGKQFPAGKRFRSPASRPTSATRWKRPASPASSRPAWHAARSDSAGHQHSRAQSNIDWANAPVYVPTTAVAWPKHADGTAQRAGVNAFGIGGLNMHCVLDEFTEASRALAAPRAAVKPAASADDEAIAVIGLGCVLPGASNPTEFWKLLDSGRDPKVPLPLERAKKELAFKFGSADVPDPSQARGRVHHRFRIRLETAQGAAQASRPGRSAAVHVARSGRPGDARRRLRQAPVQPRERGRGRRHRVRRRFLLPVAVRPAVARARAPYQGLADAARFPAARRPRRSARIIPRPCWRAGRH